MDFTKVVDVAINNGIGFVCALAMLWFAWYRETKTLPALVASFSKTHSDGLAALDRLQENFAQRNEKSLETFAGLVREERSVYQRWHEENRQRLDNVREEVRTNNHLVRNLAHQLGLREAVDAERKRNDPNAEKGGTV